MAAITFTPAELDAATSLLQDLIRLDTTNPPGHEAAAIALLEQKCRDIGLETVIAGAHEERPNLVAKLAADPARRKRRPLILSGHVDCVPADPARWTHDPRARTPHSAEHCGLRTSMGDRESSPL